jgi:N-acetylglucosamine-6-phosphate deacetylase
VLVNVIGASVPDAVMACSTTPCRELGLEGFGVIAPGAMADLVVMDRSLNVVRTYLAGRAVYDAREAAREHRP